MFHEPTRQLFGTMLQGSCSLLHSKLNWSMCVDLRLFQDARMEILEYLEGFYNRENIGIPQD